VATTFAGFIAAALGIQDPFHATPDQVAQIRQAHLLVAQANAMIPGVFGLSAWDLVGALPIPESSVPDHLTDGGDWRWINRGAVDLLNANPTATKSAVLGLPKATALYGSLPDQLASPDSFASRIQKMLAARKQFNIINATLNSVPPTGNPGVCVLTMTLPSGDFVITALNYGRSAASAQVDLTLIPPGIPAPATAGQTALDIIANQNAGTVSSDGKLQVNLQALSGQTLLIHRH
jgi:trehalose synthase